MHLISLCAFSTASDHNTVLLASDSVRVRSQCDRVTNYNIIHILKTHTQDVHVLYKILIKVQLQKIAVLYMYTLYNP